MMHTTCDHCGTALQLFIFNDNQDSAHVRYADEVWWRAVWATTAPQAHAVAWDDYPHATEAQVTPASLILVGLALPNERLRSYAPRMPGGEDRPQVLRLIGWREPDEGECERCGLCANGLPEFAVCEDCERCPECGHHPSCTDKEGA